MSKVSTLHELDIFLQKMKAQQYDGDRACSFGRDKEPCGQCQYNNGDWRDIKIEWRVVDE